MADLHIDEGALAKARDDLRDASERLAGLRVPDLSASIRAAAPGSDAEGDYAGAGEALAKILTEAATRLAETVDVIAAFEDDMTRTDRSIEEWANSLLRSTGGRP